ncbi:MAG: hypothetical protein Kow0020_11820 [Wenzhouxiangellaceae bacterium]
MLGVTELAQITVRWRSILVAALVALFGTAQAADESGHLLNFQDAELRSLIATVADITGRNIVVDPAVSGRVTVIGSQPLDADSVYEVFQSILAVHGYATVEDGQVVRVVPSEAARAWSTDAAGREEFVFRLIGLEQVRAEELVPLLRSMVAPSAWLAAHPASNSLLVADRAAGVRRLEQIVRRLDAATGDGPEVIVLNHASAAQLAELVERLYPGDGAPPVIADPRTNSLIVSGPPAQRMRLRALIGHLDTPLDTGGSAQVVYLRYADAESLVPVLEGLLDRSSDGASSVRIQAHPETNAIVISGSQSDYRELRSIIEQVDIRRAQVLVEAIIAEVAADTGRDLGIQWQFFESGDEGFFGGTNFATGGRNILNLSAGLIGEGDTPALLPGGGLNLGYVGGRSSLLGIELLEIGALAQALASDGDTNVLSTPSIVTLDNHPARINVGQEVPFLSGSFVTEGSGTTDGRINPFQTIQREEVGLKLSVTPHVNDDGSIMLAIEQEVSSLAPVVGAVDLVTNKRTVSTRVMVPDGALLVIGGLISDELNESTERVPGLSRLPLLGELFTYRSSSQVKRNLMVFIRPRILHDAGLADQITSGKYQRIRDAQLRQREGRSPLMRADRTPLLPELQDFLNADLPLPEHER